MTREELVNTITKNVATEFRFNDLTEIIDSGVTEFIIDEVLYNFESRSCTDCRWCVHGGEFSNDECYNTSLSAHLELGAPVADDFCCNRWEPKDE